jgi:hypothetical protein
MPTMPVDSIHMLQLFQNLIGNGIIKFCAEMAEQCMGRLGQGAPAWVWQL